MKEVELSVIKILFYHRHYQIKLIEVVYIMIKNI